MTNDLRPDDEPDRQRHLPDDDDVFADIPAFDVIDGELMPRARNPRR